jgi:hypothetical protein
LAVFNIWFAGTGAYFFVRRLGASRAAAFLSGLAFAGSGIMQLVIEQWGVSSVYAWLPWVLYTADRALEERHLGWTAAAAAAIALQLVAGHVQYAVYTLFVLGIWVLWRVGVPLRQRAMRLVLEYAARSVVIVALGVGAALIHLAPLLELSALSGRAGGRVSSNSPPLYELLRSVAPQFFGDGGHVGSPLVFNDLWYAGVVALVLAIVALVLRPHSQVYLWTGLAVFAVAVAYGLGPFLYVRWLPGLNGMLPIRIGYVFVFAVAVLAAFGLDVCIASFRGTQRGVAWLTAALAAGLLVIGLAAALREGTGDPALRTLQAEQLTRASTIWLLTVAILAAVARASPRVGRGYARGLAMLPAIVLMADLATAVPQYNTFVAPEKVIPASPAVEWLHSQQEPGRVLGRGVGAEQPVFVPNVQMLYGFPSVAGYDSLHTRDYEDFWAAMDASVNRGASSTPYSNVFVRPQAYNSPAASLLGVRYVASTVPLTRAAGFSLAYNDEILIYRREQSLPRAFFVSAAEVLDRDALVARLADPTFDPTASVLLNVAEEPPVRPAPPGSAGTVRAEITASTLNIIAVRVEAPTDGWLVLGDANYPGWSATVNGEPTRVYSAYLALRAVPVGTGQNIVRFEYVPSTFNFSVPVSIGSLAVIVALAMAGVRERVRKLRT